MVWWSLRGKERISEDCSDRLCPLKPVYEVRNKPNGRSNRERYQQHVVAGQFDLDHILNDRVGGFTTKKISRGTYRVAKRPFVTLGSHQQFLLQKQFTLCFQQFISFPVVHNIYIFFILLVLLVFFGLLFLFLFLFLFFQQQQQRQRQQQRSQQQPWIWCFIVADQID
jgi:4-amino-4-deoxy-L-arabinose transferase-like glycosyltransferase